MRVQTKVLILVLVAVSTTLGAVIFKTNSILKEDARRRAVTQPVQLISPLKRVVQMRLELLKASLIQAAQSKDDFEGSTDFMSVSLVVNQMGGWVSRWTQTSGAVASWPAGFEQTLVKSLPLSDVRDGEMHWLRVADPAGHPLFAFLVPVEIQGDAKHARTQSNYVANQGQAAQTGLPNSIQVFERAAEHGILIGFTNSAPLEVTTEDYMGTKNAVYLVDDRGYVAAHTEKTYIGSLFSEDPIVKTILNGQGRSRSMAFEDLGRQSVWGHYEHIDRTNLYAVITMPRAAIADLPNSVLKTNLTAGLGIGFLGIFLTFLFGQGAGSALNYLQTQVKGWKNGDWSRPLNLKPRRDEIGALAAELESVQAQVREMAAGKAKPAAPATAAVVSSRPIAIDLAERLRAGVGLAEVLRNPLSSILAHAQLMESKVENSELQQHSKSIEGEIRKANLFLERISDLATPLSMEMTNVQFSEVVEAAILSLHAKLESNGIRVVCKFDEVPMVMASSQHLQKAVEQAMANAITAMRDRVRRELELSIRTVGDFVELVIADSGIGMPKFMQNKIFEPFYTDFPEEESLGLGLSFVEEVVRKQAGQIEISSIPGDGTSVHMKLPVSLIQLAVSEAAISEPKSEFPPIVSNDQVNELKQNVIDEPTMPVSSFHDSPHASNYGYDEVNGKGSSNTDGDGEDDDDESFSHFAIGAAIKAEIPRTKKTTRIRKPKMRGQLSSDTKGENV